jgi:hypothetical protein
VPPLLLNFPISQLPRNSPFGRVSWLKKRVELATLVERLPRNSLIIDN